MRHPSRSVWLNFSKFRANSNGQHSSTLSLAWELIEPIISGTPYDTRAAFAYKGTEGNKVAIPILNADLDTPKD
jgi:hypothetical protein